MIEKYIGTSEASRIARVSSSVIRGWFEKGMVRGYRVLGGGRIRVTLKSLCDYMRANGMQKQLDDYLAATEGEGK